MILLLPGPAIAELAVTDPGGWAEEYLLTENERPQNDWSSEYLKDNNTTFQAPPMNRKWAEEYLDQSEHRPW